MNFKKTQLTPCLPSIYHFYCQIQSFILCFTAVGLCSSYFNFSADVPVRLTFEMTNPLLGKAGIRVRVCNHNHHDIYDEALDSKNIEMAFEKFRQENDYLNPQEIKETREKYGLSQRGFASLIGVGSASIARYERGSVPTNSHHTLLKNIRDNHDFVKDLYDDNGDKLRRLDKRRIEEKLDYEDEQDIIEETIQLYLKKTQIEAEPIYNGYIKFEFDKLMNLIIYFSEKMKMLSKTKLMKLLFYTDFRNFKESGLSVTGLSYKKLPYGPVPSHHFLMLDSLIEKSAIEILPTSKYHIAQKKTRPEPCLPSIYQSSTVKFTSISPHIHMISYHLNSQTDILPPHENDLKSFLHS